MELGVDGVYKQRPAVLQIRDHGHADDADRERHPPIRRRLLGQPFLDYLRHMPLPPLIVFLRLSEEQPISRTVNIPSGSPQTYILVSKTPTFVNPHVHTQPDAFHPRGKLRGERRARSQDLVDGCIRYEQEPARDVVW